MAWYLNEVVILAGGYNTFSEGDIMPSECGRAAYFMNAIFVLEMASSVCCKALYFEEVT